MVSSLPLLQSWGSLQQRSSMLLGIGCCSRFLMRFVVGIDNLLKGFRCIIMLMGDVVLVCWYDMDSLSNLS